MGTGETGCMGVAESRGNRGMLSIVPVQEDYDNKWISVVCSYVFVCRMEESLMGQK